MTMARYSGVVTDQAGNIITNAKIEVRREIPGQPLAVLKSDRAGAVGIANPFDAEVDGTFFFHAAGGAFQVRAYTGASGAPTFERILRYEAVGLSSESDGVVSSDFDTKAAVEASDNFEGMFLRTAGYAVAGDGGGALYKRAVSEPSHGGKIQSADGSWWELAEKKPNILMFGAVGDADDANAAINTAAINAAFAYCYAFGFELHGARGTFKVAESAVSSGHALLNKGVSFKGITRNRMVIAPAASVGSAVSIMRIKPDAGVDISFLSLHDFLIYPGHSGTKYGKYGIEFDLTAAGVSLAFLDMRGVYVAPGNDWSVYSNNDITGNPVGNPRLSRIEFCDFWEGVRLYGVGDTVSIRNNVLIATGARQGAYVYQTNGSLGPAGHVIVEANNGNAAGGFLKIESGRNVKVIHNNIEHSAGSGSNGSVIDIDGTGNTNAGALSIPCPEIIGNHIGVFGTSTVTAGIRLKKTVKASVHENDLVAGFSVAIGILVLADSTGAQIGANNFSVPGAGSNWAIAVSDLGVGTQQTISVPFGSGGAAQVLKRTTAGGSVTVAQVGAGELSPIAANTILGNPTAALANPVSINTTGSGDVVRKTSPSIATPAILGLLDISDSTSGQIKFPASQNASSDANTLDDYEEGTWTPVLTFATPGDLAVTYVVQQGSYTKIGRVVFYTIDIQTSAFTWTTASGGALLTGLPFTSANVANQNARAGGLWQGITKASFTDLVMSVAANESQIRLSMAGSGQVASLVNAADMPTAGTVRISAAGSYPTT